MGGGRWGWSRWVVGAEEVGARVEEVRAGVTARGKVARVSAKAGCWAQASGPGPVLEIR